MREFIVKRFNDKEHYKEPVDEGLFNLYDKDGRSILPEYWENLIGPDMEVTMRMSEDLETQNTAPDNAQPDASPASIPWRASTKSAVKNQLLPERSRPLYPKQSARLRSPSPTPSTQSRRKKPPASLAQMWTRPAQPKRAARHP